MELPMVLSRILDGKLRAARKLTQARLKEARKVQKRAKAALTPEMQVEIERIVGELDAAYRADDTGKMNKLEPKLSAALDKHLGGFRKPAWRESLEQIGVALIIALLLRAFVFEAFKIPSGSMIPTLAIGDQIFVNKYLYGIRIPFTAIRLVDFALPKRGEVVVFIVPIEPHEDYIKRVIGLPGDEVMVRRGVVYVNGEPVERKSLGLVTATDRDGTSGPWYDFSAYAYEETLDDHTYTVLQDADKAQAQIEEGPFRVPEGHIFVMGDNRDHSFDSRRWPDTHYVPMSNILGRAMFVWWSWGKGGKFVGGEEGLRFDRLGTWID